MAVCLKAIEQISYCRQAKCLNTTTSLHEIAQFGINYATVYTSSFRRISNIYKWLFASYFPLLVSQRNFSPRSIVNLHSTLTNLSYQYNNSSLQAVRSLYEQPKMAQIISISDMPSEILSSVFEYLSNDDLLNLSSDLLSKGLSASAAKARFEVFHCCINRESLGRLYRLSQCSFAADVVRQLTICTLKLVELTTEDIHELQWKRHLTDYKIERPMPGCVTMRDIHEEVGVSSWRECRTCAGQSPLQFQSHLIRTAKAQRDLETSGPQAAILARCAKIFSKLTAVNIATPRQNYSLEYALAQFIERQDQSQEKKEAHRRVKDIIHHVLAISGRDLWSSSMFSNPLGSKYVQLGLLSLASASIRYRELRHLRPWFVIWMWLTWGDPLASRSGSD